MYCLPSIYSGGTILFNRLRSSKSASVKTDDVNASSEVKLVSGNDVKLNSEGELVTQRKTAHTESPVKESDICPFNGLTLAGRKVLPDLPKVSFNQRRFRIESPWGAPIVWSDTEDNVKARQQRRISRVAMNILAIAKYVVFLKPLIASADKYFMKGHDVTYVVFTDNVGLASKQIKTNRKVKFVSERNQGWPNNALIKFQLISKHRKVYKSVDYIFQVDADMRFVSEVNSEALGLRVGTLHPGYWNKPRSTFTYDSNPRSLAYVKPSEGEYYYASGVFCGCRDEIITMSETLEKNIQSDLTKLNYIAVWHDESHLNRYFVDHPPTKILSPEYCFPEYGMGGVKRRRILALNKNHAAMRSQ